MWVEDQVIIRTVFSLDLKLAPAALQRVEEGSCMGEIWSRKKKSCFI